MDANILKTAMSSIMFVTEEDIRRLHAYNPKKEESRDVQYLLSLSNIARNVSKSFASIENLIQTYMREIAGIDNKTWNRLISASVDIVENLAEMIRKNPTDFLQYIDLSGAAAKLEGREVFTPSAIAAEISEKHRNIPIYGVSGLYSEATDLTRTDDAVGMSYTIDRDTGSIKSDFDDVFPWNKTEIVELDAGKFVSFPEMYFRIGVDDKSRITDVAVSSEPSAEGKWYKVDPFMYGCYGASIEGEKMKSVAGVDRANNYTRDQFRNFAMTNGKEYLPIDLYHRNVLALLWLIEWATKDSASIMTGRIYNSGTRGGFSRRPCGGTDGVATPSGFETEYGQMRWHYIEDAIGNMLEIIDGIYASGVGQHDFVTDDAAYFSDDKEGKKALAYKNPENGVIAAYGWDDDKPFLFMPIETVENDENDTYFCNEVWHGAGSPVAYGGASYAVASASRGVFCVNANGAAGASAFLGSRLLIKS